MKILKIQELLSVLEEARRGKTVVCYNGSFDVLHVGHVRSLQEARAQGDILVVLLNSDASVRGYKGPGRPIVPEGERAELLAALECIDYVALFDELTPINFLEVVKPEIFCNGSDYGENCIERKTVEHYGGRVELLSWLHGKSTSELLRRIRTMKPANKAIFFDRDMTLINDPRGYTYDISDFQFMPHCIEALQMLEGSGYKKVIITNQSGIGRGYFTLDHYNRFTDHMLAEFRKDCITIDRVYYCPHTPEDACRCRKPENGLFLEAVKDLDVSLSNSWYIGDKEQDVIAGRMANIKTIKLGDKMSHEIKLEPDYYASDLLDAVRHILTISRSDQP